MDRSGRAVSMTKGALRRAIRSGAPGFVAHGANPSNAVGELLPGRGGQGGQAPTDKSPSTKKPSQRQPSTVTHSIRGRQSIIVAGSPQSGHGPRVARKVRPAACRGFPSMAISELVSGRGTPGSEGADRLQHSSRGRGASGRQSSERDLFDLELDHGGVGATIPSRSGVSCSSRRAFSTNFGLTSCRYPCSIVRRGVTVRDWGRRGERWNRGAGEGDLL
jgi:hypothetical protein